ncbi:hypothetical protein NQ317_007612 [Molorchus minor]|uniref:Reverse transcriptase domain-containing protein n=1 Tax=Molorchus minor TaxID=1323400 RepID=A0ABQ9JQ74_9CUCU|nr:hypothetical protein NQ317_007612 [Molorchus minor]
MYRQILIRPEERKYQRILWRFSPSDPVQIYQLNTVTYGISSSPYLAIRTLLQLAKTEELNFPVASEVISSDIYIDDIVTGHNSLENAKTLRDEIVTIMGRAQLELHSSVALAWICSSPHRWKPFVGNRVSYIQDRLPSPCWHHVKSQSNPADCASRGLFPLELFNHPLWWNGPEWLRGPITPDHCLSEDPIIDSSYQTIVSQEEREVVLTVTVPPLCISLLDRYSSLLKIQRVLAYCIRFVYNLKHPAQRKITPLTSSELHHTMNVLVKVNQVAFAEDINNLQKEVPCSKPLRKLNPLFRPPGYSQGGRSSASRTT